MSAQNVTRFLADAPSDPALSSQIARRPGETPRELAHRLAKLSHQTGRPFTAVDFLQHAPAEFTGELTTEQLYAIAGTHISEENERPKKDIKSLPWTETRLAHS